MPLQVVHGNQRLAERVRKRLGIGDANQQRTGKPWAAGNGDGVEIAPAGASLIKRGADDRDNVAQMLSRGKLWNDAAKLGVRRNLRGDNIRQRLASLADDRRSGLVARAFNAENQTRT